MNVYLKSIFNIKAVLSFSVTIVCYKIYRCFQGNKNVEISEEIKSKQDFSGPSWIPNFFWTFDTKKNIIEIASK